MTLPRSLRDLVKRKGFSQRPITFLLKKIPGGPRAVFALLRQSDDADAKVFMESLDEQSIGNHGYGRAGGPQLEEVLEKAGIAPRDFVAMVSRVAFDFNIELGHAMAAFSYPELMRASLTKAMDVDGGTEERKIHLQHTGYLPTSKGMNVAFINKNGSGEGEASPGEAPPHSVRSRSVVRTLPKALAE